MQYSSLPNGFRDTLKINTRKLNRTPPAQSHHRTRNKTTIYIVFILQNHPAKAIPPGSEEHKSHNGCAKAITRRDRTWLAWHSVLVSTGIRTTFTSSSSLGGQWLSSMFEGDHRRRKNAQRTHIRLHRCATVPVVEIPTPSATSPVRALAGCCDGRLLNPGDDSVRSIWCNGGCKGQPG